MTTRCAEIEEGYQLCQKKTPKENKKAGFIKRKWKSNGNELIDRIEIHQQGNVKGEGTSAKMQLHESKSGSPKIWSRAIESKIKG